jgi:hypothetical protein
MELMNDNSGPLQRVYAATTPDELTSAYEEWAAD